MKRILVFAVMLLLVGCTDVVQHPEKIERAVIETKVDGEKGQTEEIMVFDAEELEDIRHYLSQTDWQPNTKPDMARHEDVNLKLFVEAEQNMPERIDDYLIWFEQNDSMTIISNVEAEGFGRLAAKYGKPFKQLLDTKTGDRNHVIDRHGQLENVEQFERFLADIEVNRQTAIKVTRYTIEGDPIYWTAKYDGEQFDIEIDNREDAFGSKEIEHYRCDNLERAATGTLIDYNFTACGGDFELNLLSIETENTSAFNKLQIPDVSFTIGNKEIKTYKGAYSWQYLDASTGQTVTTMTDHASPNQMIDIASGMKVNLNDPIEIMFEREPTNVEFNVWNDEGIIATYNSLTDIKERGPVIVEFVGYWGENRATYATALIIE
ncbi:DUF4362 domain-containing protein [Solibacillus silvestris]|uniref:DUF4362 domain-containing protein n=1 Tax=Solibacillus silvestris TaxID=76853 RepID=UPI003F7E7E38